MGAKGDIQSNVTQLRQLLPSTCYLTASVLSAMITPSGRCTTATRSLFLVFNGLVMLAAGGLAWGLRSQGRDTSSPTEKAYQLARSLGAMVVFAVLIIFTPPGISCLFPATRSATPADTSIPAPVVVLVLASVVLLAHTALMFFPQLVTDPIKYSKAPAAAGAATPAAPASTLADAPTPRPVGEGEEPADATVGVAIGAGHRRHHAHESAPHGGTHGAAHTPAAKHGAHAAAGRKAAVADGLTATPATTMASIQSLWRRFCKRKLSDVTLDSTKFLADILPGTTYTAFVSTATQVAPDPSACGATEKACLWVLALLSALACAVVSVYQEKAHQAVGRGRPDDEKAAVRVWVGTRGSVVIVVFLTLALLTPPGVDCLLGGGHGATTAARVIPPVVVAALMIASCFPEQLHRHNKLREEKPSSDVALSHVSLPSKVSDDAQSDAVAP